MEVTVRTQHEGETHMDCVHGVLKRDLLLKVMFQPLVIDKS